MILSIGMIVKNEEKYLDRCLSALKPILDNVESELIITDTGSEDRTVEIAEKYTDKILHFKWIDNFAAARNTAFEAAKGEWFMFLDADEIFLSCDDIIRFFSSGEYQKYNSASFVIKSLYSDGSSSRFNANRLTKILPQTSFSGIIHETLNTYGEPVKELNDIAEHYGYLSDDKNEEQKKFDRNSKLLRKKFKINGDKDPLIYLQLYECYYRHDRTLAEKYLESGIRVCEKRNSPVLIALYCHKAHLMYFDEKYDETLMVCNKYFGMSEQIRPGAITTDCEMTAFKASSLYNTGKLVDTAKAYISFFRLFADNDSRKKKTPDADMLVYYLATEKNLAAALYEFLSACININDSHMAYEGLKQLELSRYRFAHEHAGILTSMLSRVIESCESIEDKKVLSRKLYDIKRNR